MRLAAVLAILLGGIVGIIGSTQTWLDVTLSDGAQQSVAVPGADALSVLAPLSLAALALGLALTIVGRVLRYVFGAVGAALGAGLAWGAARIALEQPIDSVAGPVTDATGLSGVDGISRIVSEITSTPWPTVTIAAGVLILVGSLTALLTAHRWSATGRKYRTERTAASGPRDAVDSWDELSRGEDPTT
ncbi:Trp biosynthesis-associated membrane protein [Microbacterium sp. EYE_5]|nr:MULTISPECIES: Trp biosynthesis-associated membrane protein [unclassified Microbacterium]MCK6247891.1 Trp biosynthesis-associated membrane protein [Microbacterium sp. EYE_78]MCK6080755.1 Trp biosynthesis-associated membrane protein [Microbacterium sp. EYE_382]MCK6086026.1 Trp biosynthesis-associated membrane protein [Microbacterium sp. EYE_384]MCK6124476.1 Trp biosynthesis-associated membrane protein [Microbacterium sp. EYE_80]MCK6127385.1 Trp biosynthesis-associated membrane protein [Microb